MRLGDTEILFLRIKELININQNKEKVFSSVLCISRNWAVLLVQSDLLTSSRTEWGANSKTLFIADPNLRTDGSSNRHNEGKKDMLMETLPTDCKCGSWLVIHAAKNTCTFRTVWLVRKPLSFCIKTVLEAGISNVLLCQCLPHISVSFYCRTRAGRCVLKSGKKPISVGKISACGNIIDKCR